MKRTQMTVGWIKPGKNENEVFWDYAILEVTADHLERKKKWKSGFKVEICGQ